MIDRAYIVDDDEISIFVTSVLLETEGFAGTVESYLYAEEALKNLLHGSEAAWPEIIFLDLNMPILSGWAFLDALTAQQDRFAGRCHVFILTSSVDPQEKERAGQYALVKGFLRKPLEPAELTCIQSLI